jgi:hypothetical protein
MDHFLTMGRLEILSARKRPRTGQSSQPAVAAGQPKITEIREIKKAAGVSKETLASVERNAFFISTVIFNVPFTDHFKHSPGELVLVLVMPLVDFRPPTEEAHCYGMAYNEKQGSWSPETNRRNIVAPNMLETPKAQITNLYESSTGMTNLITMDSRVWNEESGEVKYNPFRVLPIPLDSCLSGYKT